jgi:hypothetical protein
MLLLMATTVHACSLVQARHVAEHALDDDEDPITSIMKGEPGRLTSFIAALW